MSTLQLLPSPASRRESARSPIPMTAPGALIDRWLVESFTEYLAALKRSPRTIDTYTDALAMFVSFSLASGAPLDCDAWTPALLTAYVTWLQTAHAESADRPAIRAHAPASCALYLSALSTLLRYLARNALLANPNAEALRAELADLISAQASVAKEVPPHLRLPEPEIVARLLAAVDTPPALPADAPPHLVTRTQLLYLRDRAMLYTLATTGVRVSELAGLTRENLDRKQCGAHVYGKGGKWRLAFMSAFSLERIEAYLVERKDGSTRGPLAKLPLFARHDLRAGHGQPQPLSARSIERALAGYARQAGILADFHLTPHSLRHYVATVFLNNTGDLAMTQDLLGHADPRTTRRYADVDKAALRSAHRAVFDRRKG